MTDIRALIAADLNIPKHLILEPVIMGDYRAIFDYGPGYDNITGIQPPRREYRFRLPVDRIDIGAVLERWKNAKPGRTAEATGNYRETTAEVETVELNAGRYAT